MTSLSSLALWQVQTSNGFMFLDVELLLYVCCIPRSSSSPVIFFLVFSFLIYNTFFLLLFLFEVSPLSLHVPSNSGVWFLLSLTWIFLLLPVLTPHYVLCPTDLLHPTPNLHFKGFQSCDVLLSHRPSPYFCTVQGHTSNQCFHHSFLEASSFFSILPLVILSSWKRLLYHCYPRASIRGGEGRAPQILGRGSQGGSQGGRWSRGRVVKYYYILPCTGSMFESGYF